ncbi:hypothetical protein [Methylosinus sp. Sm6]|uniref:hypothetical protein n=1 Tax=Methylosinus sp. Sm6 TaxID=2866948 RepID=UPI001C9A01CC|nr:hypothetical protein [Methylosinus sp. Sm6]MBY6243950.1 hypothetical protein [Methylosinus sp. Sm6]
MAYYLTILRTRQGKADPIDSEELRKLTERLHGVRIEPSSLKGGELDLVVSRDEGPPYRFVLQHGELWIRDPEDNEIQMMIEIAAELNARVRGDEFETFRTPTETYLHPDDKSDKEKADVLAIKLKKAMRCRQWFLNFVIILAFAALAAITAYFSR